MKLNHLDSIIRLYLDETTVTSTQLVLKIEARLTALEERAHQWRLHTLPLIAFLQNHYRQREEIGARFILFIKFRIAGSLSFEDANIFFNQLSAWKDQMIKRPFAQISPVAQEMRNIIGMLHDIVIRYQVMLQMISQNNRLIYLLSLIIKSDQLAQQLTKAREDFDQELAKYLDCDKRIFHTLLQSIRQASQFSLIAELPRATRTLSTPISTMSPLSLPSTAETLTLFPLDDKHSFAFSTTQTQKKRKRRHAPQPSIDLMQGNTVLSLLKQKQMPDPASSSAASLMVQRGMWQHASPEISLPQPDPSSPIASIQTTQRLT